MSCITTIQAVKPTPESEVGISFVSSNDGAITIKSIADTSIFASTALRVDDKITQVNETNVTGMDVDQVRLLLHTTLQTVVLKIRRGPSTLWTLSYEKTMGHTTDSRGRNYKMIHTYRCNSDRSIVPPNLSGAGVSATKWAKIVDACNNELVPAIKESTDWDANLAIEMDGYTGKQMRGGFVGFGNESSHEKMVLRRTQRAAILNNNISLLTCKVVTMANALLNKHDVMVQPTFEIQMKSLKTNGLSFTLMDE